MKSYNIYKNRKSLTSEEINSFKDFNSLMNKFELEKPQASSGIKSKWIIITASISSTLIIAGVILYLLVSQSEIPVNPAEALLNDSLQQQPYVNPPLKDLDIPYQTVVIFPNKENLVSFNNGVKVTVPAQSIVDEKGMVVSDSVILKYREFSNPAEFFLAGIPMEYDSAGTKYTFESAGMIELFATDRAGNRLQVANGKTIKLSIESGNADPDFNLYYLDTLARNWKYEGRGITIATNAINNKTNKGKSKKSDESSMDEQVVSAIIEEMPLELKKPIKPIKSDDSKHHFTIQVDEKSFPELAVYANTMFEVDESYVKFVKSDGDIIWSGVKIEKCPEPMLYLVTFSTKTQKKTYRAKPVLKDVDYDVALKKFEADFNLYNQKLAERKAEEERLRKEQMAQRIKQEEERRAEVERIKKEQMAEWVKQEEERIKGLTQSQLRQESVNKIVRAFSINNFGFWNCDRVWVASRERMILSEALFEGKLISDSQVFIANMSQNALISFYQKKNNYIFPHDEYVIWSVSSDNRIVYMTKQQVESVKPDGRGNHSLELVALEQKLDNPGDFVRLYKNGFKGN